MGSDVKVSEGTVRAVFGSLRGVHQREGVRWMCRRETHPDAVPAVRGGCVADGMGLGKTYEVSALLRLRPMTTLVVVPLATLMQWQGVLTSHGRGLPFVLRGHAQADGMGAVGFDDTHTVLTCYSMFQKGIDGVPAALKRAWGRIVLDEGHIIRNPKSNAHTALRKVAANAAHRWLLTGTPVNNSIGDFESLVSWLGAPGLSVAHFKQHLMLRRTLKNEAERSPEFELPSLSIVDSMVVMGDEERILYELIEHAGRIHAVGGGSSVSEALFAECDGGDPRQNAGNVSQLHAMEAILRCRQACTHPCLMADAVALAVARARCPESPLSALQDVMLDPRFIKEASRHPPAVLFSSKIRTLVALVSTHPDEKSLIFCDWIKEMDLIQEALLSSRAATHVVRYQGSMDLRERERALRSFATLPQGAVLLAQIQCGGTGLNIQAASRVYLMRPAWNPCVEQQAISRAHRLGQTRHVMVVRLVAADSIDVRCLDIQRRKLAIIDSVLGEEGATHGMEKGKGALDVNEALTLLTAHSSAPPTHLSRHLGPSQPRGAKRPCERGPGHPHGDGTRDLARGACPLEATCISTPWQTDV